VSTSRLTRLATVDKFPPVKWLREKYSDWTDATDWWWLMNCGYCFSFWAAVFVVGWGLLAGVYETPVSGNHVFDGGAAGWWWVVNSLLAISYLAAILMAHDADEGDDD
jgi:hypothetical protein